MGFYVVQTIALLFAAWLAGCAIGCWMKGRLNTGVSLAGGGKPASRGASGRRARRAASKAARS
ncbi:MAG: hypothetical protein VX871_09485 [Pseudomonadota bacterium]|nr:hypothetical protein [Pseudomonadota bacterium]